MGNGSAHFTAWLVGALERQGFQYADFTEGEQQCISAKIRVLKKEGVEGDEAVARAIQKCAPEKARNRQAKEDHITNDPKPDIPGGKFRAEENADGTWNILNVPIFAQHKVVIKASTGEPQEIDVDGVWQELALQKFNKRFTEDQYLPPLHLQHHIFGKKTQPSGFFKLKSVRKARYQGQELWTTFADLVQIPADMFRLIRQGMVPFRSVEIHDITEPEIDSLALLDDEVPFFRFNLLTIGDEIPHDAQVGPIGRSDDEKLALRAYQAVGAGARVLMYMAGFKESGMDPKKDDVQKLRYQEDEEKKKVEEKAQDVPEKKVEGEGEQNRGDVMGKVAEGLNSIAQTAAGLAEMISGGEERKPEAAPAPVEMQANEDEEKKKKEEMSAVTRSAAKEDAVNYNANTEVSKLQGRLDAVEMERKLEKKVAETARELVTYGLDEAKVTKKLYEYGRKGIEQIDVYADTVREHVEKDPPANWTGEIPAGVNVPANMQKYAAIGQQALEKAINYGDEFDTMSKRMSFSYTREQYVDDQLKSEGIKVPETQKETK